MGLYIGGGLVRGPSPHLRLWVSTLQRLWRVGLLLGPRGGVPGPGPKGLFASAPACERGRCRRDHRPFGGNAASPLPVVLVLVLRPHGLCAYPTGGAMMLASPSVPVLPWDRGVSAKSEPS